MQLPGMEVLMTGRSEQEAVEMRPIKVKLGTAEYEIPVLRIAAQRAWRQQFIDIASKVQAATSPEATAATFRAGLAFAFLQFPELVCDLVFAYDKSGVLPREAVMDEKTGATEEQMARAFSKIAVVAFPFAQQLAMTVQILEKAKSFQASARSTR
jgi:hypothetical protein